MGKCTCHPEKDTRFQCLKHGVWLCDECLSCRDPELYCKHRSACPIWFIEKRRKRLQKEDIVFTESDLKNLIYSKGAVYAGFTTLLREAGLGFAAVDRVLISGGFGQYLDIEKEVRIGLLPDIDRSKFCYLGNSSIAGAYTALLSESHRREARGICHAMAYIDFSSNTRYMDEFTSALFLPHTNLEMFPTVVRAGVRPAGMVA